MTELRIIKLLIHFVLITAITSMATAQEKTYDLSLNLEKGSRFKVEEEIIQHIEQEITGMKQEMYQTYKTYYTYLVSEKSDSDYLFVITYNQVYYEMNNPMTGISRYDTKKDGIETDDNTFKNFAAMIGKSFSLRVSNTGEIKEVIGTDEMIEEMIDDMKISDTSEASKKYFELVSILGDQSLKSSFENTMNIYPGKNVNIGDSWAKNNIVKTIFPVKVDNVFTLDQVKKKEILLSLKAKLESDPEEKIEMNDMEMSYDLKGDMTGSFKLNSKTHFLIYAKVKQTITGKVIMNSAVYGEMTIPMSVEMEVTRTFK